MIAGTPFILADVQDIWPTICHRLLKTKSPLKTVLAALTKCRHGESICLEGPDGVVVLTLEPSESAKMRAMVLLAFSSGKAGAFKRNEPSMVAIARDLGADELAFKTDRQGWTHLLGPEWTQDGETFVRSI